MNRLVILQIVFFKALYMSKLYILGLIYEGEVALYTICYIWVKLFQAKHWGTLPIKSFYPMMFRILRIV